MKRLKQICAAVMVSLFALVAFSACGSKKDPDNTDPESEVHLYMKKLFDDLKTTTYKMTVHCEGTSSEGQTFQEYYENQQLDKDMAFYQMAQNNGLTSRNATYYKDGTLKSVREVKRSADNKSCDIIIYDFDKEGNVTYYRPLTQTMSIDDDNILSLLYSTTSSRYGYIDNTVCLEDYIRHQFGYDVDYSEICPIEYYLAYALFENEYYLDLKFEGSNGNHTITVAMEENLGNTFSIKIFTENNKVTKIEVRNKNFGENGEFGETGVFVVEFTYDVTETKIPADLSTSNPNYTLDEDNNGYLDDYYNNSIM